MKKHVLVGAMDDPSMVRRRVFVEVNWDGERLSLSGVVGPKPNGDAISCGQIVDELTTKDFFPFPGIDTTRLVDVWKAWHLNYMNAGCSHQRASWDMEGEIEIVTYQLTSEALREKGKLERSALASLRSGETVTFTEEQQGIAALPFQTTKAPDSEGVASGRYEVKRRETRSVHSVRHTDHPRGLLGKPCEVCDYKYGSAWLKEDVPADVISFLETLPDNTKKLARCWR